jgi:hypothetical protein
MGLEHHDVFGGNNVTLHNCHEYEGEDSQDVEDVFPGEERHSTASFNVLMLGWNSPHSHRQELQAIAQIGFALQERRG